MTTADMGTGLDAGSGLDTGSGPGATPEAGTEPAVPEAGASSLAAAPAPAPAPLPVRDTPAGPPRRGPADPVKTLMHQHRTLCERAVDPMEIAAGLEAHGVTDRTAARFRHRDVFSLAEELYARVPRAEVPPPAVPAPGPVRRGRAARAALHVLPGAVCAATVAAVAAAGHAPAPVPFTSADGPSPRLVQTVVAATGAGLVLLALRLCVRHGPLRARYPIARSAGLWTCWLAGYALGGDWLLAQLLAGGPDLPPTHTQLATASALALTCAVVPAAWCAHWFAGRARRGLADSRCLTAFASGVRPLLLIATAMQLAALVALSAAADAVGGGVGAVGGGGGAGAVAAASALGALLFLARLLARHGFPAAAAAGPAAAVTLEAAALACVLAARSPGLEPLGRPVETAVTHLGPSVVPAVACALPALGLLLYALGALTGASAHAPAPDAASAPVPAEAGRP
ncbi:hypothetical protein [Streptomyces paromomycinus]|uniref:Integral membrane protein n=1 Tax=Streptomyces paromomycinus TaxID=92743 RepID=A0A401W1N7_STREY|nr:hypothetical protein [Streptomyces paromomycinus]GCD43195.1 hypothetical protein GKJPGBOP_02875 [Streptomyces paromomycinus]